MKKQKNDKVGKRLMNPVREGVQPLTNKDVEPNTEMAERQREAMLDGEPPRAHAGDEYAEALRPGEVNPLPEIIGDEGGGSVHSNQTRRARGLRRKSDWHGEPIPRSQSDRKEPERAP